MFFVISECKEEAAEGLGGFLPFEGSWSATPKTCALWTPSLHPLISQHEGKQLLNPSRGVVVGGGETCDKDPCFSKEKPIFCTGN